MILDGAFEMWDWLTKKKTPPVKEEKEKVIRVPKAPEKTAKQLATENNEPYVAILNMDIDPNNLHQGAFELDWNEIFIARLGQSWLHDEAHRRRFGHCGPLVPKCV
jgi:hypothetical protein